MQHRITLNDVNEVIELYEKYGSRDYIKENITQIEHAIQAAMSAEENGDDVEMILAALLHDIGHLIEINSKEKQMVDLGVINHEIVGRDYLLSKGFGQKIANLVGNHVKAKRYLITKFPQYYQKLSEASKQTFKFQKGLMNNEELREFKNDVWFVESLQIRGYDDQAKFKDIKIKPLSYYREMMIKFFGINS